MDKLTESLMEDVKEKDRKLEQLQRENEQLKEQLKAMTNAANTQTQQGKKAEAVKVKASPAEGHAIGFHGSPKARITKSVDGSPVQGLPVTFYTSGPLPTKLGEAETNADGIAETDVSSFNPIVWASAALVGYDAVFPGNGQYSEARDHASVTPGL